MKKKEKNRFYVYIYLDPRKPGKYTYGKYLFEYEPFYVGKGGTKKQLRRHLGDLNQAKRNPHKWNKIQKILNKTGGEPVILKVKDGLLEIEAFLLENKLIDMIGREDLKKGPLTNKAFNFTAKRSEPSEDGRRRMAMASKGKTYEEIYGLEKALWLKEQRRKSNHKRGTSKETKEKMSRSKKGKKASETTKLNMRKNKPTRKTWQLTSPSGEKFVVEGLVDFCKKMNLQRSGLIKVAQGKWRHSKGWKCEYVNK